MAIFENFPYTNMHEMNLDYILETQKKQEEIIDGVIEEATEIKNSTIQYRDETEQLKNDTSDLHDETLDLYDQTLELENATEGYRDEALAAKNSLTNALGQIETNKENIDVNSARIDTFTNLAEGSTTGDAELTDIRVGANSITYDTAGDAVRAQYNILKDHIEENNSYFLKQDNEDLTQDFIISPNLYNNDLYVHGKYLSYLDGYTWNPNAVYNTSPFIRVEPGDNIYIRRWSSDGTTLNNPGTVRVFWYDDDCEYISGQGYDSANAIEVPAGAYYFRMSDLFHLQYPANKIMMTINYDFGVNDYVAPGLVMLSGLARNKAYARKTGSLTNGQKATLPHTNIKKNNVYEFIAKITSFSAIQIGNTKNAYNGSWITVDETNLSVSNYYSSEEKTDYPHGLTISDYLNVKIIVKHGTADIQIMSGGSSFSLNDVTWHGDGSGELFALSDGSSLSEYVFTWSSADIRDDIWMFGDSYMTIDSPDRWPYYMLEDDYDNVLINAYPGENSPTAFTSLLNLMRNYGVPKKLLWATGMNDGADTDSGTVANTQWKNNIDKVINLAEVFNFELILATIPTVPSINNEAKNSFVRSSGYRYVDFAKAVGANSSGVWYSGMLESAATPIHPTALGAKALYNQVLADLPEITYSK